MSERFQSDEREARVELLGDPPSRSAWGVALVAFAIGSLIGGLVFAVGVFAGRLLQCG